MKRDLFRRNRNVLLWLGALPLVLAVVAYETSSQHVRSVEETLSTDDFIQKLDELLSTVEDAETGQRGYLLTGQEHYLAPFNTAKSRLAEKLSGVNQTAARNGVPATQIADLHRLIAEKMTELELTIDLRSSNGFPAAIREVETNRGQPYMTEIRSLIATMENRQTAVFRERLQLQRRRHLELNVVLGLSVILGFVLVFLAYRTGALYARERDRVEAEIRGLNERLETRVKERTAELDARTRELEVSSLELERSNADLSQFASVASHDLQEPLRTIAVYMDLIARRYQGTLDETAEKYIRYAMDGATRMQALMRPVELLASRDSAAQHPTDLIRGRVADCIAEPSGCD
jgi:CHASE3 domain sensor protein